MLEFILDRHVFYVLMGVSAVLGVTGKVVVGMTLRRLVVAAESMGKSNHPLMRLVRAKFEHTCMISEKVENVGVFVEKYIYEYRVGSARLHTWRRIQMAGAGACLILGGVGAFVSYQVKGVTDQMAVLGGTGAALALIVFLIHMLTDEEYQMDAVRNYMVDYLENIYQHRYEKAYRKENRDAENAIKENATKENVTEEKITEKNVEEAQKEYLPESDSLIWAMYKTEPLQVEDERMATAKRAGVQTEAQTGIQTKAQTEAQTKIQTEATVQPATVQKVRVQKALKTTDKSAEKKKENKIENKTENKTETVTENLREEACRNQRIREILEEFMA